MKRTRAPRRKWVRSVTTDSTHPPPGTFTGSAADIARKMARKDVSPKGLGSAIRMVQYFINRGGRNLSASRRAELERAKRILQRRAARQKSAAKSGRRGAPALASGTPPSQTAQPCGFKEETMVKHARDVMTPDPACCTSHTTLDQVARMMVQHDCGEIPVVDVNDRPIGVVTDRDIVCRVVADGKNPMAHTVDTCMTQPVVAVRADDPIEEVVSTMEEHQIRRVPVVDERGRCTGIISQADLARVEPLPEVGELVREVSRNSSHESRTRPIAE